MIRHREWSKQGTDIQGSRLNKAELFGANCQQMPLMLRRGAVSRKKTFGHDACVGRFVGRGAAVKPSRPLMLEGNPKAGQIKPLPSQARSPSGQRNKCSPSFGSAS